MELSLALRKAGVTDREAEVLDALGARLTNVEIAERLYISVRTVESHVSALLRKLAEPDRRALARRAGDIFTPDPLSLPASLADATVFGPFVGRAGELAHLERLALLARTGGVRRAVLVTGEAGIGKTRLAAEAALRMHAQGATVIHGRCQQDALVPYQALFEAARPLSGPGGDPRTGPAVGAGGDETARFRFFEEFDHLLTSRPTLVVFVLDDVQWIDPSGLQLLRHVLHQINRSPLVVIATGRPEAAEPRHPLAALLGPGGSAHALDVIELGGLTLGEAEALARSLPAVDTERTLTAWVRTAGNPFLLSELLRHRDTGRELPPTARDAIVRRVAGLGPSVFDVLSTAAVAGEVFHLGLVADALGGDIDAHAAALERAFVAGLVVENPNPTRPSEYRFAHAIVREALVAVISPSHRSRLHLKVAGALDSAGPVATPDVARHRHAALPDGDPRLAHRAALDAYHQAMDGLAYEVAASFADLALDAIDAGGGTEANRAEAILHRGRACIKAGDLERGTADCRLALELANRHELRQLRAEAVLGWADGVVVWGRQPELRAALEHVLSDDIEALGLRALLKAKLAQALYYEDAHERRSRLSNEAVDDARQSGGAATLASVLATTHVARWEPAHLDQRTDVARQVVTIAAAAGRPELEAQGLGWLAVDLLETGDLRGADDAFARHAALAGRLRQRLALRDVELWAAMRAILDGRFDAAAERVERARDLGEAARDPSSDTIYWVQRYWIALERGRPSEMDELVEPCERIVHENTHVPAWRAALALLHARRTDHDAARTHYDLLAVEGFGAIPRDVVWLNAMTYLAETCAILNDADRAPQLLDTLAPYADRVVVIDRALACKGSVNRYLGLLAATTGDVDHAELRLTQALDQHQAMRAVPLAERTRNELTQLRRELP